MRRPWRLTTGARLGEAGGAEGERRSDGAGCNGHGGGRKEALKEWVRRMAAAHQWSHSRQLVGSLGFLKPSASTKAADPRGRAHNGLVAWMHPVA
jgi:hypothetical protein